MIFLKKIFFIATVVSLVHSCNKKEPHPDYIEISGKITNAKSSEFLVFGMGKSDYVKLNEDGTFKDTLVVKNGKQQIMLNDDKINALAFFENGDDIYFTADAADFENTVKYELDNADYNNYLAEKQILMGSDIGFDKSWYRDSGEVFQKKVENLQAAFSKLLSAYPNIPAENIKSEKAYNESYIKRFSDKYKNENSFSVKLKRGNKSPVFENYENNDGTKTSLSDFKGNYVFIDVWATWCIPCKAQFPHIKELEKKYENKNIHFVGISVDFEKDYDKWKKAIKDNKLSGTQILAPKAFSSEFIKAYNITSIPRFILIDPEGNIVDFNAPKPSEKDEIKSLLSSINI